MRIHFDNVNFQARSGPNTFANRLARQMFNMGHEVLSDSNSADVSLVFIEPSGAKLANKIVQRLDGIWFKPNEFENKNVNIKKLYQNADCVIWQSEFDKNMTIKWWGSPKFGSVIRNGIEINPVKEINIPLLTQIRSQYDMVFVCSANWHPQKRLRSNIELFMHIKAKQHPNSCLLVLGANPDVRVPDPHIYYFGSQPSDVYLQVYAMSNWMIHLAWADHCPNVVVESLSQGTPVICSSIGGTKELVKNFGYIIDDQPYDYQLFDYDKPPNLSFNDLNFLLPQKESLNFDGMLSMIDINSVCNQYVKIFESMN